MYKRQGITFTNAREDALRRDFTINALLYDPATDTIRDYVNGQADLHARLIRAIGDPVSYTHLIIQKYPHRHGAFGHGQRCV